MSRRTTQLRARFDLGPGRLRVVWAVTEPGVLTDLVEDVTPELAELLADRLLQVTDARWVCLYGEHGVWLRADLRVQPWTTSPAN